MLTTIIADASFCPEYKVGGYGFWIVNDEGSLAGGGTFKTPVFDNNVCEFLACVNALYISEINGLIKNRDKVIVQTDNSFAISMFGSDAEFRRNRDKVCLHAYNLVEELLLRLNLRVEIRHIKGHTAKTDKRSIAQQSCDRRARSYMVKARKSAIAAENCA